MQSAVSGKSCGSCTECCKMMEVSELHKAAWTMCSSCAVGVGCKIYPDRPQSCREFLCGWLTAPFMGPDLKPDKCHVVIYFESNAIVANCDPDKPDAWRMPNVLNMLHGVAHKFGDYVVLVRVENRLWRILPDRILSITS
jgi:hypothetical protein